LLSLPAEPRAPHSSTILRWLLIATGSAAVAVGVAGIFLPLLPSFEFFFLAALCFGRSSPAAYRWLMTNRLFGRRLSDYREHRGASLLTKSMTIGLLWLSLSATSLLFGLPVWLQLVLGLVAVGVTWHVLTLKTMRR
jgi:uncharacterized protein